MKSEHFFVRDWVSVVRFLSAFKLECDNNIINERPAMCLMPHFMKRTTEATLKLRMALYPKLPKEKTKQRALKTYIKSLIHLLETYTTKNMIKEEDKDILCCTQRIY